MHYHSCPSCYQDISCTSDCTIEPDLHDDGKDHGSHTTCDSCMKEVHPQLNKMLKGWDRVHFEVNDPYYRYKWSDKYYHWFEPLSINNLWLDLKIEEDDFKIDFDKYNGLK